MKITLAELQKAGPSLTKLFNNDNLDGDISFMLGKAVDIVDKELALATATHTKLVTKYGKKEKDGSMKVIPANLDKFYKDIDLVLAVEVDLPIEPIRKSELPSNPGLSGRDFSNLKKFIIEDKK